MRINEILREADEWEESGDKWKRFQKWSIDQMMRSTERTATGNHVSELENKYFGHPITYDTSAGQVLQQPFGTVTTNVGAGRKWTAWVKSIMENYQDYEAEWKADSAAELLDNPEYKKFLDRAYTDFMSMGENTTEQREQHAMALSGYQVKHFGGKLFGSLFGNIKGARASMTPEVYGALEKAEYDLGQKNIIDYDNKRNEEQLKFWQMLPYPIKLMVAAGMGKTPAQVEAILSTSGKSDNEIMGAYFNASEPEKTTKSDTQKESMVPRQPRNKMPAPQKPSMAVSLDRWKQSVLNRYPEARFATQKMINGATFATDMSGQVGIYDPKNSYAKVGPESLKTESKTKASQRGGQVHGQPQWQMPIKPKVQPYTPGKPLPQSLQQKLDNKPNTGAPQKPLRMRPTQGAQMPVTKEYWQKAVLARYPNARFVHEKMIDGAIYAMDNSGQVGSYEPKRSYAKVGPESLKTESASPLRNKANHLRKK